jgi:glycosyltransferase involved in cell wall biosynthesis
MTQAPLFSIIIPTYNQSATLAQAISGALDMHCDGSWDFEVLVLDDASSEEVREPASNTESILSRFADSRLRFVRNEMNMGRVGNYRNGLHRALGHWVVVCDGDDYFVDRNFLTKVAEVLRQEPDLVLVGMGDALAYADHIVPRTLVAQRSVMDGKDLFLEWGRLAVPHLGAVYRRDLALELDFYRCDILSSDWESLLRLVLRGKVALLPGICGHWRQHGANASRSADWEEFAANLQSVTLPAASARKMGVFDESILQVWERDRVEEKLLGYMTSLVLAGAQGRVASRELNLLRKKVFQCKREYGIGVESPSRFALRWWVHEACGARVFVALYRAKHLLHRIFVVIGKYVSTGRPRCAE